MIKWRYARFVGIDGELVAVEYLNGYFSVQVKIKIGTLRRAAKRSDVAAAILWQADRMRQADQANSPT